MAKGPAGYGRYNDDPQHVGCPRAKSDMTPCIARDGSAALADDKQCVGCNMHPFSLLDELRSARLREDRKAGADHLANTLRDEVRAATEALVDG